jgi:hypothetical protein
MVEEKTMKAQLIMTGITFILRNIKAEDIEAIADRLLDIVEVKYKDSPIVMKGCSLIRDAFEIEDND